MTFNSKGFLSQETRVKAIHKAYSIFFIFNYLYQSLVKIEWLNRSFKFIFFSARNRRLFAIVHFGIAQNEPKS